MRMATISSHPVVLGITRVFLGLTLLGRSYLSLAAPTRAPVEFIETPSASVQQLHEYLSDATLQLANHAKHVYFTFKNQRFGSEADINPRGIFNIAGLPDVKHLESTVARLSYTEEDLLRTHRANLGIYYSAMQLLITDELLYIGSDDFLHNEGDESTFYHILHHIERTSRRIDEIMTREGFRGETLTPVSRPLSFDTQTEEHVRNFRDLIVLYEIYKYTNEVLYVDARTHENAHAMDSFESLR